MLTVGELLRRERERKGYTLRVVEKEIKIREKFLHALEQNDWSKFSSKIYIHGVIRNYAVFLGLDPEKMLAFFRRDYERRDDIHFRKRMSARYLHPETKKVIYGGIISVCLIFLLYFGYQLKAFLSPPKVIIKTPKTTTFRSVEEVKIQGITDKESTITIFGVHVFQKKDGSFEYTVPLKKGHNYVTIEVVGPNGKKTTVKKDLILE